MLQFHKRTKARCNMKISSVAVLLALSAQHTLASTSSSLSHTITILNSTTQRIKRHRQPSYYHRELHQPSSVCSCSPITFQLRLDFSKDCSYDSIKTNAGIRGTLCLLGEAGNAGVGPLLPTPPSNPPVGSEATTEEPISDIYYPTFSPTDGEDTEQESSNSSSGGTINDIPMDTTTYYPTFSPTSAADDSEKLPTNIPTVANIAPSTRGKGKGKGKKARNRVDSGNGRNNNNNADTSLKWIFSASVPSSLEKPTIPTYQPTSIEGRMTPFPTDDTTYPPTFSDTSRTSIISDTYAPTTYSHAKNLEDHTSFAFSPMESVRQRQLQEKMSVISQWTSIPPNDAFFLSFPEWKVKQEEIYQLKQGVPGQTAEFTEPSSRRTLAENSPTSYPTYLASVMDDDSAADDDASNNAPTTTPTYITTDVANSGGEGGGSGSMLSTIPNKLLSAQFLETDTSPNMNIINQDDQYLDFSSSSEGEGALSTSSITSYTLSFTSISAYLNPNKPLNEQMEYVPGGVILILVGQTEDGEIVRNRVMWTYTMGCDTEDKTVEVGDTFGWTMFDNIDSAMEEFCPAVSSSGGYGSNIPTYMPTSEAVSVSSKASKPSSKSSKPHRPSSSSDDDDDDDDDHESSSTSKAGKLGLSMPSSEDLVDQFDFGKSGKSSTTSTTQTESSEDEVSSSNDEESSEEYIDDDDYQSPEDELHSMPGNRLLYIPIKHPEDLIQKKVQHGEGAEENNEIFGRRLSPNHRETKIVSSRNNDSSINEETLVKGSRYDKPLKKRLRNRSV